MATTPTVTFRLDNETNRMLDELAKVTGGTRTSALKLAVRKFHRAAFGTKKGSL